MTEIEKITYENWHEQPFARRLLDRLTPDKLSEVKCAGFPNDFYTYVGRGDRACRTVDALKEVRAVSIDDAFGMTFDEADQAGVAVDYINQRDSAPTVYDALNRAFAARREKAA